MKRIARKHKVMLAILAVAVVGAVALLATQKDKVSFKADTNQGKFDLSSPAGSSITNGSDFTVNVSYNNTYSIRTCVVAFDVLYPTANMTVKGTPVVAGGSTSYVASESTLTAGKIHYMIGIQHCTTSSVTNILSITFTANAVGSPVLSIDTPAAYGYGGVDGSTQLLFNQGNNYIPSIVNPGAPSASIPHAIIFADKIAHLSGTKEGANITSVTVKVANGTEVPAVIDSNNAWHLDNISIPITGAAGNANLTITGKDTFNNASTSTVLLKRYKIGDSDGSGTIDMGDFGTLMSSWNKAVVDTGYNFLDDFNADDISNVVDFSIMMSNWT